MHFYGKFKFCFVPKFIGTFIDTRARLIDNKFRRGVSLSFYVCVINNNVHNNVHLYIIVLCKTNLIRCANE